MENGKWRTGIRSNFQFPFSNFQFRRALGFWVFPILLGSGWAGSVPLLAAEPVASTELLEHLPDYDGQTITYEGEAVQDLMLRGDHGWINVNDGVNALGVWASEAALRQIERTGTYHQKGDRLRITGTFHAACPEHGGDVDLHAESLTVSASGAPFPHPLPPFELALAALAVLVTAVLARYTWRAERARQHARRERQP